MKGEIMTRKVAHGVWSCSICGKSFYADPKKEFARDGEGIGSAKNRAETCEREHAVVYVPLTRQEIQRIIMMLYSSDSLDRGAEALYRRLSDFANGRES
jgi:hypothetical protein